jgi:hypothetical protein
MSKTKKALIPKKTVTKPVPSTGKRSNFDLVAGGVCPHDSAKLLDAVACKGVGVIRACSKCQHTWYLNRKIRTTKCQTCASSKRQVAKTDANVLSDADAKSNVHLDTPPLTPYNSLVNAGMAELADAADLKSAGAILVGSSPSPGTISPDGAGRFRLGSSACRRG